MKVMPSRISHALAISAQHSGSINSSENLIERDGISKTTVWKNYATHIGTSQMRERSSFWFVRAETPSRSSSPSLTWEICKMRIAQVAPLTEAVPPKLYGGTERVVHWLTEELVAQGHDVTLFASGNSHTSGKLDAGWPRALRLDGSVRDPNALHMEMLERVRQKCDREEFDILHFHLDYYPFSLFSRQPTPFLTTLHGRLDLPEHQPVFTTSPKPRSSRSQMHSAARCRRRIS